MNGSYRTVPRVFSREISIRRSRFIAVLSPARTPEDLSAVLERVRREYPAATHYCYGFVGLSGAEKRFSDDGEPGGTAGRPILGVLERRGIRAVAAVVVRYFGGVKLGANGLVSAYARSVAGALDEGGTVLMTHSSYVELRCGYEDHDVLRNLLKSSACLQLDAVFGEDVRISAAVPTEETEAFLSAVSSATGNRASVSKTGEGWESYPERTPQN